jgi:hypothetical protein
MRRRSPSIYNVSGMKADIADFTSIQIASALSPSAILVAVQYWVAADKVRNMQIDFDEYMP